MAALNRFISSYSNWLIHLKIRKNYKMSLFWLQNSSLEIRRSWLQTKVKLSCLKLKDCHWMIYEAILSFSNFLFACSNFANYICVFLFLILDNIRQPCLNPLNANTTKWSNTLKQFIGNLLTNCLSVFDHLVNLALKGSKVRLKSHENSQLLKRVYPERKQNKR